MTVEEVLGLAFERGRSQEPVLGRADPALDRAGLERLFVQVLRLQGRLDQPQLIRRVHDREVGLEADAVPVAAQQPHAEPVEGADENTCVAAHQIEGAPAHLVRRLVGEGHGRNPPRLDSQLLHEPGDPVGDHPGLARAGAGDHELRPAVVGDRRQLFRVQAGAEVHTLDAADVTGRHAVQLLAPG